MSTPPLQVIGERLERKLQPAANGCIEWMGNHSGDRSGGPRGYGMIKVGESPMKTHRLAWELANGPIPKGLIVCHKCDNPPCCNVDHLFLGTYKDNVDDCIAKGRRRFVVSPGERHGRHKLTADQVIEIRRLYAAGGTTYREIGDRFGVYFTTVAGIVTGKEWRHLLPVPELGVGDYPDGLDPT